MIYKSTHTRTHTRRQQGPIWGSSPPLSTTWAGRVTVMQNLPFSSLRWPWPSLVHIMSSHKGVARLSGPGWLDYILRWYTHKWSPILVLTRPDVQKLHWSRPTRYHQCQTNTHTHIDHSKILPTVSGPKE